MTTLFQIFSKQALRQWMFFIAGSVLGVFVLSRYFTDDGFLLIGPLCFAWALSSMQSTLISRNLGWIMALPISKKSILLLNYLFNFWVFVLFLVSNAIVVTALTFVKHIQIVGYKLTFNSTGYRDSFFTISSGWKTPQFDAWLNNNAIELVTVTIIGLSCIHALCMTVFNSVALKQFHNKYWHHPDLKSRRIYRAFLVFLALSGLSGISLFSSGFGQVLLWCCIFTLFPAVSSSTALSMCTRQRNKLILGSLVLITIESVLIYTVAARGANNPSSERRVESILFLGPFGHGIARQNVAKLLEGDLKDEAISRLSDYYLSTFHDGRKIKKYEDAFVHFEAVISSKRTEWSVMKAASLFDFSELDYSDIRILFDKLASVPGDQPNSISLYPLFAAKLTTSDISQFLQSHNDLSIRYALLRSRYEGDPSLIPVITSQLKHYKDELRLAALKTLSVLTGHYVGLDAWALIKNQHSLPVFAAHPEIDCLSFKPTSLSELTPTHIPALNVCIRKRADKRDSRLLDSIESAGWLDLQPDSRKIWLIKHVFHLK